MLSKVFTYLFVKKFHKFIQNKHFFKKIFIFLEDIFLNRHYITLFQSAAVYASGILLPFPEFHLQEKY